MSTGPASILTNAKTRYKLVHHHPHPILKDDEVLIEVEAIGLNPIDWKSNAYGFAIYSYPWVNGRECAGRVIQLGREVTSQRLKLGDRVFVASTNYRDNRTSTFQSRCAALAENCGRIPDFMSFEDAAGIGVAFVAAASALYECLQVPGSRPVKSSEDSDWILIWGAAATSGILASQLAKASGLRVIGVASKKNFEYIRSRGVDVAIDRENPEEVNRIAKKYAVSYAIDCVGKETSTYAIDCLTAGGTLVALVKRPMNVPENIDVKEILIKKFHENRVWAETVVQSAEKLLEDKELLPPRVRRVGSGIAGIGAGLQLLQDGHISGEKVVVSVRETPVEKLQRLVSSPRATTSRPSTPVGAHEHIKRQKLVA